MTESFERLKSALAPPGLLAVLGQEGEDLIDVRPPRRK